MRNVSDNLIIGLILLSSDFRVVGMILYARKILGPTISNLDQNIFAYHKQSIQPKIDFLLKQCCSSGAHMPVVMIIDVLNKFLLVYSCRVKMDESQVETHILLTN